MESVSYQRLMVYTLFWRQLISHCSIVHTRMCCCELLTLWICPVVADDEEYMVPLVWERERGRRRGRERGRERKREEGRERGCKKTTHWWLRRAMREEHATSLVRSILSLHCWTMPHTTLPTLCGDNQYSVTDINSLIISWYSQYTL